MTRLLPEIKLMGIIFFACEHCSKGFQGFMNGGAGTGRWVVEEIISRIG